MLEDPGARANAVGLAANVSLAAGKLVIGVASGSAALVADGFNSAGDIVATAIGWAGYAIGKRPPDEDHHWGHGNAESAAGLIIGGLLFATGLFIAIQGVLVLVHGVAEPPDAPAAWMALATIVVKEALYRYVSVVGARLNSPALLASARDHRADVAAASAVVVGVVAARMAWPWLDPLTAVAIGLYVAGMAVGPIRSNVGVLMDEAPPEVAAAVRAAAAGDADVRGVDEVRVHPLGPYVVVDLEIACDGELSLTAAHEVAHRVAERVRGEVEHVRDVRVHVNPVEPGRRSDRGSP